MNLIEIVNLFASKKISGAPVVDHLNRIIGMISEKDIIAKLSVDRSGSFMEIISHCMKNKGSIPIPIRQFSVCEIMISPPVTVTAKVPIADISVLMTEKRINRLPVVQNDRRPIGIITRANLLKSYCT